MSYDFSVYLTRHVTHEQLTQLAEQVGLAMHTDARGLWDLSNSRGVVFGGCGPDPMEQEDLPEELVEFVLAPRWMCSVSVEGSGVTPVVAHVTKARRFSRALAELGDGIVHDRQLDKVITTTRTRTVTKVPRGALRPLTVAFAWYAPALQPDQPGVTLVEDWARLARHSVPEANPRRFGLVEALRHRLDRDGVEMLHADWLDPDGYDHLHTLYFDPTAPFMFGCFQRWPGWSPPPYRFEGAQVTCVASVFDTEGWRTAMQRFFIEFALARGCFHACAEVVSAQTDPDSDSSGTGQTLPGAGRWLGLHPAPVWWNWFAGPYLPLVRERLAGHPTEHHRTGDVEGIFHAAAPRPADVPGIASADDPLRDLRTHQDPPQPRRSRPPLRAAAVFPAALADA